MQLGAYVTRWDIKFLSLNAYRLSLTVFYRFVINHARHDDIPRVVFSQEPYDFAFGKRVDPAEDVSEVNGFNLVLNSQEIYRYS